MHVSVVGASGHCGRQAIIQLIERDILGPSDSMDWVKANPASQQPYLLEGWYEDLQDAYPQKVPDICIKSYDQGISGDIILMVAGKAAESRPEALSIDARDRLARQNLPLLQRVANNLHWEKDLPPLVIVVTNPVELGVQVFSTILSRERVIGLGSHLDSLRFRRELAKESGANYAEVEGYMLGEHGGLMLPIWSTVKIPGNGRVPHVPLENYQQRLGEELRKLQDLLSKENGATAALNYARGLSPDLRAAVIPMATHFSGARTALATAKAVADLLEIIKAGRTREIAVQYLHKGEGGIYGPCGNRVLLGKQIETVKPILDLDPLEQELIKKHARAIQAKVDHWLCARSP